MISSVLKNTFPQFITYLTQKTELVFFQAVLEKKSKCAKMGSLLAEIMHSHCSLLVIKAFAAQQLLLLLFSELHDQLASLDGRRFVSRPRSLTLIDKTDEI